MAELAELIRQRDRMHDYYNGGHCGDCPLNFQNSGMLTCDLFVIQHTDKAKKIITEWVKEHPVLTNADKFKEVFGFMPDKSKCPSNIYYCENVCDADKCSGLVFWGKEYKEPEESDAE